MRLAVIGSRNWQDDRLVAAVLDTYVGRVKCVVSGGADGPDKMGVRWARRQGIDTKVFEPDHKNRKHAFHHRNRLIAEDCDELIAFWDGRSSGTRYTIDYARRLGKPVRIVRPGEKVTVPRPDSVG